MKNFLKRYLKGIPGAGKVGKLVHCVSCGSTAVVETGNETVVDNCGVEVEGTEYQCKECDCTWSE